MSVAIFENHGEKLHDYNGRVIFCFFKPPSKEVYYNGETPPISTHAYTKKIFCYRLGPSLGQRCRRLIPARKPVLRLAGQRQTVTLLQSCGHYLSKYSCTSLLRLSGRLCIF